MATEEKFNYKLLVEGVDDLNVVKHLHNNLVGTINFDLIECKGYTNLTKVLEVRLKGIDATEEGIFGVLIDADEDIKNRWVSIRNQFIKQGINIPENLPKEGLIFKNFKPDIKIGIWIMPNNNQNGMLEDFIKFLVPNDDSLLPIAKSTLDTIEAQNLQKYATEHKSKALIHTWLAWQEDSGTPMGLSITKKYLTTDEETCMKFVNWLKELFKPD